MVANWAAGVWAAANVLGALAENGSFRSPDLAPRAGIRPVCSAGAASDYDKLMQANLMLDVMDDNMDGKLPLAELKGGPQSPGTMLKKYFALIDTDHDGSIDAKELAAAAKLMPRRGGPNPAVPPTDQAIPAVASAGAKAAPDGRAG